MKIYHFVLLEQAARPSLFCLGVVKGLIFFLKNKLIKSFSNTFSCVPTEFLFLKKILFASRRN